MFWYLISSLLMGVGGLIVYIYYMLRGQFDDPEDVKYQILREEPKE